MKYHQLLLNIWQPTFSSGRHPSHRVSLLKNFLRAATPAGENILPPVDYDPFLVFLTRRGAAVSRWTGETQRKWPLTMPFTVKVDTCRWPGPDRLGWTGQVENFRWKRSIFRRKRWMKKVETTNSFKTQFKWTVAWISHFSAIWRLQFSPDWSLAPPVGRWFADKRCKAIFSTYNRKEESVWSWKFSPEKGFRHYSFFLGSLWPNFFLNYRNSSLNWTANESCIRMNEKYCVNFRIKLFNLISKRWEIWKLLS